MNKAANQNKFKMSFKDLLSATNLSNDPLPVAYITSTAKSPKGSSLHEQRTRNLNLKFFKGNLHKYTQIGLFEKLVQNMVLKIRALRPTTQKNKILN